MCDKEQPGNFTAELAGNKRTRSDLEAEDNFSQKEDDDSSDGRHEAEIEDTHDHIFQ